MVQMNPVVSSNIVSIGHDPDTSELHVEFSNGSKYIYHGISADQHAALVGAKSIGSHLHNQIKTKAKSVRNASNS